MTPNLFLIGPPKVGSSSVFEVLSRHPQIMGSRPKETFYLLDANYPLLNKKHNYYSYGWNGWHAFYTERQENYTEIKFYLEGTTHTLFQDDVPKIIQKHQPDAILITILRKPSDRILSSFLFTKYILAAIPPYITFDRYVKDLLAGNPMPYILNTTSRYVLEHELLFSNYILQLKKWEYFLERTRLIVEIFEKLKDNPDQFYLLLQKRLNLKPTINNYHIKKNVSYKVRNFTLHRWIYILKKYFPYRFKNIVKPFYYKYFMKDKPELSNNEMESFKLLDNYFLQSIERLHTNFEIDISRWN